MTANLVLCWAAVGVLFVLPNYLPQAFGGISMGVGSAVLFTLFYLINWQSLRGRDGSLRLAHGLLASMWIAAFAITVASVCGWIH